MPSMDSAEFWKFFDETAVPNLGLRAETFRQAFAYLDRLDRAVGIVETGCMRRPDHWSDGCSTLLLAKYAETRPGSVVFSVDIDPAAVELCKTTVAGPLQAHCGDSISFLKSLADRPPAELLSLDLLYLDSYDVNYDDPMPSAVHHLKELAAIAPLLSSETLVMVDDSPLHFVARQTGPGNVQVLRSPRITGKAKLIAEFASQVGARQLFGDYQVGWVGFGRPKE